MAKVPKYTDEQLEIISKWADEAVQRMKDWIAQNFKDRSPLMDKQQKRYIDYQDVKITTEEIRAHQKSKEKI